MFMFASSAEEGVEAVCCVKDLFGNPSVRFLFGGSVLFRTED